MTLCRALLTPYGKLADRYSGKAKFLKFYGNANENTKSLFRDRLQARATPTLSFFNSSGMAFHHPCQHALVHKQVSCFQHLPNRPEA